MKTLKELFGGATPGAPASVKSAQSLIHTAVLPLPSHKQLLKEHGLRRGMWVVLDESKVGIITDLLPNGKNEDPRPLVRIAIVDELGLTIGMTEVLPRQLRQAAWKDIPEARRPEREAAAIRGYRV